MPCLDGPTRERRTRIFFEIQALNRNRLTFRGQDETKTFGQMVDDFEALGSCTQGSSVQDLVVQKPKSLVIDGSLPLMIIDSTTYLSIFLFRLLL